MKNKIRTSLNGFNLEGETNLHATIANFISALSAILRIPYVAEMPRTPGFNGLVNTDQAGEMLRGKSVVRR